GQGRKDLRDLRKAKRVDVDGFGAAADRDLLVALEVSGCAARRAMCPRVDRDGGAELAGEPLEARGEVYHVADRGGDEPIARPRVADEGPAARDAYADGDRRAFRRIDRKAFGRGDQLAGGLDRNARVVGYRIGCSEDCHDSIAQELHDGATAPLDHR